VVNSTLAEVLSKEYGSFEEMKVKLKTKTFKPVSYNQLTNIQRINLETSIKMIEKAEYSISLDMIDVVNYKDESMLGQWVNGKIRLAQKVLNKPETTLEVLVHEFCHSFGTDGEKSFHQQTERVFAKIAVANMNATISVEAKPIQAPTTAEELVDRRKAIIDALNAGNETVVDVAKATDLDKKVVRRTLQSMAKKFMIYAERRTEEVDGRPVQQYIYKPTGPDGITGIHGNW
jgi:hypothetical protein